MPDTDTRAPSLPPLVLDKSPWAIRNDMLPRLAEASRVPTAPALHGLGERLLAAAGGPQAARRGGRAALPASGQVVVLPLTGVLTPHGSFLSYLFGGSLGGLQDFRDAFREAVSSPDIGAIVIEVDSPGGSTGLVPEAAADILAARGEKPIVAVANTQACSGAYWIGSQADEFIVTPSGWVGSIGVYMLHEDWSKANEQMGVDPTYVFAGRYKVEANMDEPLADDARAAMQQDVDDIYAMFVDAVAAGRGVSAKVVRDTYGEGRVMNAARALEAGMVDRIDTLETVVRGLITGEDTGPLARSGGPKLVAAPRAEAGDPEEPEGDPEAGEQPRCTSCGKYLPHGSSQCEDCAPEPDDDPDEDPELDPEASAADRARVIDLLLT